MPEANLKNLVEYLRHNSQKFSLEALRQHLVAQGIDAAVVEEAITLYREEGSQPPRKELSGWSVALGCFVGLVAGGLALVSLLLGLCPGGDGGSNSLGPILLPVAGVLVLLAFAAALYPFYAQWRKK